MKHECPNCKSEFKNTQGLTMHTKYCGRPKRTFNCKQCGTEKLFKYTSTNQYCSHKCAQQASIVPKDEEHYKRKRAIANEAWQRYHAKQRAQTPDNADLKLIQQIYENCPPGHEVDHIVPISKGGLHHQDNLQYLPWQTNRRKSNKLNWSERQDSNLRHPAPKAGGMNQTILRSDKS
jgi:5-methylcytosine-specific restriction endonuclease McrA